MPKMGKLSPVNGASIQVAPRNGFQGQQLQARLLLNTGQEHFRGKVQVTEGNFINERELILSWIDACERKREEIAGTASERNTVHYFWDPEGAINLHFSDFSPGAPSEAGVSQVTALDDLERVRAEKGKEGTFCPDDLKDARERILTAIVVRQGQTGFRAELLEAYQRTCAVTGCDVVEVLEAAHIVPYLGPESNQIRNGLLLRGDIHTLFDLHLIALDPSDYRVAVSKRLKGRCFESLAGKLIRLPTDEAKHPSRQALEHHLAKFLEQEQ